MSFDSETGRADGAASEREAAMAEARDLLASALALLDVHAHSPAAATVDLAIHQIDREMTE